MSFSKLPEECVSTILSLSSPRDACRVAAVSSEFRSVAASDFVWESFLPNDYNEILSRADDQALVNNNSSKKELFLMLSNSLLIDAGNKIFILEKSQGLKSYLLSARELNITWGDDPICWSWKHHPVSRFGEVAELRTSSWLEIQGKIKMNWLSRNTSYGAYLIFDVSKRAYGLDTMPMEVSVQVGSDPVCYTTVYLSQDYSSKQHLLRLFYNNRLEMLTSRVVQGHVPVLPGVRSDGWMEIELGKFFCGDDDEEVKMSLMEIKGHHLKAGLLVVALEIRPICINSAR